MTILWMIKKVLPGFFGSSMLILVACSTPSLHCLDVDQCHIALGPAIQDMRKRKTEGTNTETRLTETRLKALKPFFTDGCSIFPDGTHRQKTLWQQCCVLHDLAYWKGGTYQQRKDADVALQHCVAEVGKPWVAQFMLLGVRIGGSPIFPTRFRWGYGWSYPKWYGVLSEYENGLVERQQQLLTSTAVINAAFSHSADR